MFIHEYIIIYFNNALFICRINSLLSEVSLIVNDYFYFYIYGKIIIFLFVINNTIIVYFINTNVLCLIFFLTLIIHSFSLQQRENMKQDMTSFKL